MERTVLERIAGLKGMMDRMVHPDLVMAEVKDIFATIEKIEDKETKDKAMIAMLGVAVDMMNEVKQSPLSKVLDILGKSEKKFVPINIHVSEYLDATLIEIDKKVPYGELYNILTKARSNFEETIDNLFSATYCKSDKLFNIEYIEDKHKDIVIDMSEWNMSEEVAEVYAEGFVEYISK